jgi:hypothetical protein
MSSLVPSFSLSRLQLIFGLSWHWVNRPSYQLKVRHQFEVGGFDVSAKSEAMRPPIPIESGHRFRGNAATLLKG